MRPIIIIPAYNEESNIKNVIDKIRLLGLDHVVINDGSKDNTEQILIDNDIEHLSLCFNVGIAAVTQIGFRYAIDHGYDAAVVVDGDDQHPTQFITKLLEELENGFDYVIGSRFVDQKRLWTLRMIGSRIISTCIYLACGKKITDPNSGMRAVNKDILEEFAKDMNFVAESDALVYIIKRGYKVKEVKVYFNARKGGRSYFEDPLRALNFMISVVASIMLVQIWRGKNEY